LDKNLAPADEITKGSYKRPLRALLPYGMLATKKWLEEQGLSTHALDNAVKTGALLPLARGVYSQYSRSVSWAGAVASMQFMEKAHSKQVPSIVVGGLSALTLAGLSQYVPLGGIPHIHLYSAGKPPTWLARLSLPVQFEVHGVSQLWSKNLSSDEAFVKKYQWQADLPPVYFSCPEKAILEVLMGVPESVSFEHADELMQGLVNLSPKKLDALLKACQSIKVKRLFFWLAKRQSYPWLSKLSVKDYDLGSGKRVIARSGRLDKEFLITVPRHLALASEE